VSALRRNRQHPNAALLAAAAISAELGAVRKIAKDMSIGVLNAKAVAARAGEAARGFQPIADAIHQLAYDVTQLVRQIDGQSLLVSRKAVQLYHGLESRQRMQLVWKSRELGDAPRHIESLESQMVCCDAKIVQLRSSVQRDIDNLTTLIDEISRNIRASSVVAISSRVEAARARQFRAELEVVADELDIAANQIRKLVDSSRAQLIRVHEAAQAGDPL
jgi:methyl-accepting chemotaxis protein